MRKSNMEDRERNFLDLAPPPEYICINCSTNFTVVNGAINEIHIYTPKNEFERTITILDALAEIFATEGLKIAKSSDFNIIMCTTCAEIASTMYKHYLNLMALSSAGSYLSQLLTRLDDLHYRAAKYFPNSLDLGLGLEEDEDDDMSLYTPDVEYGSPGGEPDETWNIKTRSQKQKKRIRSERTAKNGTSRTTKGVVKLEPRLFKCHHTSCDFSERYNFKVIEHLLSVHQEKEPKTCKCGFKFYPEIYKVETHRCIKKSKKRVSTGVFPCEVCGAVFRGKKMLWYHLEKIHVSDEVKFTCQRSECGKKFDSRRRLLFHLELHEDSRLHLCSECGRTFKLRSTLMKHAKLHRLSLEERIQFNRKRIDKNKGPLGSHECKDCKKTYTRKIYLKEHIKYKHEPESWKYKCPICEKPYFQQHRLLSHVKTHDPSRVQSKELPSQYLRQSIEVLRPFPCLLCNKRFKYKAFLLTHEKAEHSSSRQVDGVCEQQIQIETPSRDTTLSDSMDATVFAGTPKLTLKDGLIQDVDVKNELGAPDMHLEEEKEDPVLVPFLPYKSQQDQKKPWKCDECGKTFTKMRALNVHYKTHTGEAPDRPLLTLICTVPTCQQKFRRRSEFKLHMRNNHPDQDIHTKDEEPEKLNLSLDDVASTSTGETKQRFQCHVCSYFFADKKYLRRHVLSHSGAHRKIPCPLCDYKTSTRTLLKGHMRTNHKEDIPEAEKNRWNCNSCHKSFAAERNLREHKLIHTGEIFRFLCLVASCGEKFRTKTSQESHLFTHHPETLSQEQLNRWKCTDCGKTFGNRKNLTEHQRMHKGIHLRIECNFCGLGVRHKAALESHVRAKHKKMKRESLKPRNLSPPSRRKRGRGRPRKGAEGTSNSSSNKNPADDGELLDLGTFWRCDLCHRSFSTHRGLSRAEHIRIKHPTCSHILQESNLPSSHNEGFPITPDVDSSSRSEPTVVSPSLEMSLGKKLVIKIERL